MTLDIATCNTFGSGVCPRCSKQKKVQERASLQKFLIGLNNTTNTIKQLICWQRVRRDPVKLYPNIIFNKNDNPDCSPTPDSTFTRLGFSLHINYSLALTCNKEQKGYHNNPLQYSGDHFCICFV
ncbi:hypothetical protein MJO29_013783, partial [Puccinia striiformis f. sp. tritici]